MAPKNKKLNEKPVLAQTSTAKKQKIVEKSDKTPVSEPSDNNIKQKSIKEPQKYEVILF